ncbi:MAG: Pycsar system effector family protein [Ferruginibacter sp.]
MNDYKTLMNKTEDFVIELYKNANKHHIVYHTLEHTQTVVTHVFEIASHYELAEKDLAILDIAAWFHDVGHLYTSPAQHEQKSVEIMTSFMEEQQGDSGLVKEIAEVIMATKLTNEPSGILQEIIRDADSYHFGTKRFKEMNKLVKKENQLRGLGTITKDWASNTLETLKAHKFYTGYCNDILSEGKEKNLARALKKKNKSTDPGTSNNILLDDPVKGDDKKASDKPNSFISKGIQTSLRLTSQNHLHLSDMADRKANILISVNAIIISVILSVLLRKIEVDKHLAIPTFIFLGFSVATIIVAITATRPKITSGDFSREDVLHKRTNLLFFGNFYNRSLEEYRWAMSTMLKDPDYLYGSIVQDIYYLGVVLGKKYKLLRRAYFLFMIGIIISVLSFTIAIIFHNPDNSTIVTTGGSPF